MNSYGSGGGRTMPFSSLHVISELSSILHKLNKYLLVTERAGVYLIVYNLVLIFTITLLVLFKYNTADF